MNIDRDAAEKFPAGNSPDETVADRFRNMQSESVDAAEIVLASSAQAPVQFSEFKLLPEEFWPQLDIRVAEVSGRWGRTILLTGQVNVRLEYQGWGPGERLYVDGHHIHTTDVFTWRVVFPYIEFNLPVDEFYVPARIDVKASYLKLFQISRFKLTVAGQIIHEE